MESGLKDGVENVRWPNYLIVLEITPLEVGKEYRSLPPHCTLLHWTRMDVSPEELKEIGARMFRNVQPLILKSEAPALFGPRKDIPVYTVEKK